MKMMPKEKERRMWWMMRVAAEWKLAAGMARGGQECVHQIDVSSDGRRWPNEVAGSLKLMLPLSVSGSGSLPHASPCTSSAPPRPLPQPSNSGRVCHARSDRRPS